MKTSDQLDKISAAIVKALGSIGGAAKSATNPHFRNTYATLENVVDASRDVLAEHGLAVMQGAGLVADGKLHLDTRMVHASGQWIESEFTIPLVKMDPQATLAALTYARRGALMAILGMPAVDDDGESAVGRGKPEATNKAPANGLGTEKRDGGAGSVAGVDWWGCTEPGVSSAVAKKTEGMTDDFLAARDGFRAADSEGDWHEVVNSFDSKIPPMPKAWRTNLRDEADTAADRLNIFPADRKPK